MHTVTIFTPGHTSGTQSYTFTVLDRGNLTAVGRKSAAPSAVWVWLRAPKPPLAQITPAMKARLAAVERLLPIHTPQVLSYLKLSGRKFRFIKRAIEV